MIPAPTAISETSIPQIMKKLGLVLLMAIICLPSISQNDTTESKKLTYDISGFVNLNAIFDFNGLDNYDDFTTSQIPINPTPYENTFRFHMTARQSRVNLQAGYDTPWGKITGFVSGDFYSGNTSNISHFRLREAYLTMGKILLGQTNTSFGNPNIVPLTIDFEGPNSAPTLRNPMIRFLSDIGKGWSYSLAIEMRGTDIQTFPNTGNPFLAMPCLVGNITNEGNWGAITLSGMADITRYFDADSNERHTYGYGGALSAIINTWDKNHFSVYIVGGNGIADFISDLSGLGYNGVPNINTNKLHMLGCYGGFIGYTQYWSPKFSSNFIYSFIMLEQTNLLEGRDFKESDYALANLFYNPFPRIAFAVEYVYGKLIVQSSDSGTANRLQFLAQYNF